jgi:hypothetical protein
MDDPTRRRTTLRAGVVLAGFGAAALTCGCGSSASPTVSERSNPGAIAQSTHEVASPSRMAGSVNLEGEQEAPVFVENRGKPAFLCAKDPVAFDLSQLRPTSTTPIKFWYSWVYARQKGDFPGFVVAFTGTATGPVVQGRVGAVHMGRGGFLEFSRKMLPTVAEPVWADPEERGHVVGSFGRSPFLTAFGSEQEREGFFLSNVRVEGLLDSNCQELRNVRVTLTLPHENLGQRFGNMTIDEALGKMTTDTDGDGALGRLDRRHGGAEGSKAWRGAYEHTPRGHHGFPCELRSRVLAEPRRRWLVLGGLAVAAGCNQNSAARTSAAEAAGAWRRRHWRWRRVSPRPAWVRVCPRGAGHPMRSGPGRRRRRGQS